MRILFYKSLTFIFPSAKNGIKQQHKRIATTMQKLAFKLYSVEDDYVNVKNKFYA